MLNKKKNILGLIILQAVISTFICTGAAFANTVLPTLPQLYVDTTYVPPTGRIINVPAGGNFQAALNGANLGDTIVLQAGAVYTGNFMLPNKTTGSGWIYIQSSNYANLPSPGNRVGPADVVNMPTLQNYNGEVISTSTSHHYRFVGIEIRPTPGYSLWNLAEIGDEGTVQAISHHIIFDRCYIHGDPTLGSTRGIIMDGAYIAVVDSYLSDFKIAGFDSQALLAYSTTGPLKIVNNFLEAAAENVMFGGADPANAQLIPSDIEIRGNYFLKPLSWFGSNWTIKDLLEFKDAQRVLVQGNVMANSWLQAQTGFAVDITPRNQNGTAPYSLDADITFQYNQVLNTMAGFSICGNPCGSNNPELGTFRVLIQNNVVALNPTSYGFNQEYSRMMVVGDQLSDLTVNHNDFLNTTYLMLIFSWEGLSTMGTDFDYNNNISAEGLGIDGSEGNNGYGNENALNGYWGSTWLWEQNALIGSTANNYPPTTYFSANTSDVGFTDYNNGNYQLLPSSPYHDLGTDGKDLGADIVGLNSATSCAVSGQCNGNQLLPPVVGPMTNQTITYPSRANLQATATDPEGNPMTYSWTGLSGSGSGQVVFSAPTNLNTFAFFSKADSYVLTLTATDTVTHLTGSGSVVITVHPGSIGGNTGGSGTVCKGTTCGTNTTLKTVTSGIVQPSMLLTGK